MTSLEPDATIRIIPEHQRTPQGHLASSSSSRGRASTRGAPDERILPDQPTDVLSSHLAVFPATSTVFKSTGATHDETDIGQMDIAGTLQNEGEDGNIFKIILVQYIVRFQKLWRFFRKKTSRFQ